MKINRNLVFGVLLISILKGWFAFAVSEIVNGHPIKKSMINTGWILP